MANLSTKAVDSAYILFGGEAGLKVNLESLAELQGRPVEEARFVLERASWGTKYSERTPESRHPRVALSLKRISGKGVEKFSRKAARATLLAEIQVSGETAEKVSQQTMDFVDATISLLDRNQGLWNAGAFYAGEYAVEWKPLAKGGLNYTQIATFEIELYLWQD